MDKKKPRLTATQRAEAEAAKNLRIIQDMEASLGMPLAEVVQLADALSLAEKAKEAQRIMDSAQPFTVAQAMGQLDTAQLFRLARELEWWTDDVAALYARWFRTDEDEADAAAIVEVLQAEDVDTRAAEAWLQGRDITPGMLAAIIEQAFTLGKSKQKDGQTLPGRNALAAKAEELEQTAREVLAAHPGDKYGLGEYLANSIIEAQTARLKAKHYRVAKKAWSPSRARDWLKGKL